MTRYVILERDENQLWQECGVIEGSGVKTAIRKHLSEAIEGGGGQFVAVPARSWKPVDAAVETKVQLRLT